MLFNLYTYDIDGICHMIDDKVNLIVSKNLNGDYTAKWKCIRPLSYFYDDLMPNCLIKVVDKALKTFWRGRLQTVTYKMIRKGKKFYSEIACQGIGTYGTLADLQIFATLTSGTPESMIAQLQSDTYMPYLDNSVNGLIVTGQTGRRYSTPDNGKKLVSVTKIVEDICAMGMSDGRKVIPYVESDLVLRTRALDLTPKARYFIPQQFVDSIELKRDLSNTETYVYVVYKDQTGTLQVTFQADTLAASQLGFNYGGLLENYRRVKYVDISGLNNTDLAQANATASAQLSYSKIMKTESRAISIASDAPILDVNEQSEITNYNLECGYYVKFPDMLPRLNDFGSGNTQGDYYNGSTLLVTQIDVYDDDGKIVLIPETSSKLKDVIQ